MRIYCATDYLLETYGNILHINPALAKVEMKIPSNFLYMAFNASTRQTLIVPAPPPATTTEVAELKIFT
jgi:hypothetical protein